MKVSMYVRGCVFSHSSVRHCFFSDETVSEPEHGDVLHKDGELAEVYHAL
jgi:hypothetical protein